MLKVVKILKNLKNNTDIVGYHSRPTITVFGFNSWGASPNVVGYIMAFKTRT